jgi:hypothetical protein
LSNRLDDEGQLTQRQSSTQVLKVKGTELGSFSCVQTMKLINAPLFPSVQADAVVKGLLYLKIAII